MEISREFYLKKLVRRKHNGLVKVVTGLKGCGKSYLLNRIFYRHLLNAGTDAGHIIRFAFDSAEDLKLIGESPTELEKEKCCVHPEKFMDFISAKTAGGGRYYLLLDEIQLLDCFELVLNGYLRRENLDVYVTAGRAERLSRNVATEFAGRGDKVRLYPLSFAEFMSVYEGDRYAACLNTCAAAVCPRWCSALMPGKRRRFCRTFFPRPAAAFLPGWAAGRARRILRCCCASSLPQQASWKALKS